MLEVTGSWRGRPGRLRLDGDVVELIGDDERLVIQVTGSGPDVEAQGAVLRVGDSELAVDGPDAAARAAELAAEIREVVRRSPVAPTPTERLGSIGLGRILALLGAVLVVVGTWAGWATVDEFGRDTSVDGGFVLVSSSLAQDLSLFSGGASLWWLTGAMLIVGGFVIERLDRLSTG
ncbi:MAG: hypothetical protein AAFZ07_10270 [Actinomycetota bacterium]